MKYLKLFEDLGQDYFVSSADEYREMAYAYLTCPFTKREIEMLESLGLEKRVFHLKNPCEANLRYRSNDGTDIGSYTYKDIDIYKCNDEWFVVQIITLSEIRIMRDEVLYYKCDQIDGLIECLTTSL